MGNGSVEALSLLSSANRPVTVYVNGKVVATVVVGLDGDSRPSEIC